LSRQRLTLDELPLIDVPKVYETDDLLSRMQAFGYTIETLQFMLMPLIQVEKDPIGSMGDDAALACLSDQPADALRLLQAAFRPGDEPRD
jgi:glutamate synthase (NADPH/NADH) large chain